MNTATNGVQPGDAGSASALVNACQQVGGALGTALLSTIAASGTSSYAAAHLALAKSTGKTALSHQSSIHGYTTAFWVSAGLFVFGTAITGLLFERRNVVTEKNAQAETEADEAQRVLVIH